MQTSRYASLRKSTSGRLPILTSWLKIPVSSTKEIARSLVRITAHVHGCLNIIIIIPKDKIIVTKILPRNMRHEMLHVPVESTNTAKDNFR